MNSNDKTYLFFKKYFIGCQNPSDGSWSHQVDGNIIAKTIYTCQVLVALQYMTLDAELSGAIKKAIRFLLSSKTGNSLYDIYLKSHAMSHWETFAPKSEMDRKLQREVTNHFEYGGRINSFSFELCFILEALLKTNVYEHIDDVVKSRINTLISDFIDQSIENVVDISHYIWALNLFIQLNNSLPEKYYKLLFDALIDYPRVDGYFEIKAPKGRPSKTPVLRCNEFVTAHIVVGVSRLLKSKFDDNLYNLITKNIEIIIDDFHCGELWSINSHLLGQVDNDPYFNALYLRTLKEYSLLSEAAMNNSISRVDKLVSNVEPSFVINEDKIMIFVSHSEKDQDLASKLVEFLESSLETGGISIRCSSVPGYQLPFGKSISQQLKEDINKSSILIAVITENSLSSNWVLFELGAAWALDITVIPILAGTLTHSSLPGPLANQSCIEISSSDAANRLRDAIKQIGNTIKVTEKTGGKSQSKLDTFIEECKNV